MDTIGPKLGKRIRELRESESISQEKLARLLGVSRPTLSQIENGERKITADELIRLGKIFGISIEALLDLEKSPEVMLPSDSKRHTAPQKVKFRISVPQKNLKKFREILIYILNKIGSRPNIGETVLYKLLYFIDFDYYELHEQQLIGATYKRNLHGPTPLEFKKIVERMIADKEIEKVKSQYFNYPQTKYLPLRPPDLTDLKADEIECINKVLNRLGDMNANEISQYSHNDIPWLTTKPGGIIPYESVFYRASPYSHRSYGE